MAEVHHKHFESPVLRPGETYKHHSWHVFTAPALVFFIAGHSRLFFVKSCRDFNSNVAEIQLSAGAPMCSQRFLRGSLPCFWGCVSVIYGLGRMG